MRRELNTQVFDSFGCDRRPGRGVRRGHRDWKEDQVKRLVTDVANRRQTKPLLARSGTGMVVQHRSSEEWLVAVNDIIRRFRQNSTGSRPEERISFDDALALIRKLGFTTGEAIRLLRDKKQR